MGYRSTFTLTVHGAQINKENVAKLNEWLKQRQIINYALTKGEFVNFAKMNPSYCDEIWFDYCGEAAWDEHEQDMLECSKAFPEFIFCLHGEGAERFDYWDEYYQNGNCERCEVEWKISEPKTIRWP